MIDNLLYRQKAVSGMETRRPGESAEQFFKRKVAGYKMLNAEAGTSEAKQLENDVEVALMNAQTQWHWGAGDHEADYTEDDGPSALLLTSDEPPAAPEGLLQLTHVPPPPAEGGALVAAGGLPPPPSDGGTALVAFDEAKATAGRKRVIVGSEGIRLSGNLVPRAAKDALSNEKLRPVDSGRGLALLEKMGWRKGQGLGRSAQGTTLPVEAAIKSDMGGLRVEGAWRGVAVAPTHTRAARARTARCSPPPPPPPCATPLRVGPPVRDTHRPHAARLHAVRARAPQARRASPAAASRRR